MTVNPIEAQRGVPRFPVGHPSLAKGDLAFKPVNEGLSGLGKRDRPAWEARGKPGLKGQDELLEAGKDAGFHLDGQA
jgi:hypothetical protein